MSHSNSSVHRVQQGVSTLQRREFLRRGAALSAAGVAAPWALSLAAMGEAAAATTVNDYKALVCVFLYGANDHNNTVVPFDAATHATYTSIRASLATPRDQLLALNPRTALPSSSQMGLAPQLTGLKSLFDAGRMGVVLNVGPLVVPTTLAQYYAKSVPLPPKLFSHNDQQSIWQSSLAEGSTSGWGGRLGDLFLANNATSTFTCMNVSGNAVFMSGQQAVQYQVSSTGAVKLSATTGNSFGSPAVSQALQTLTQATSNHWMEAEHARIMKRAVQAEAQLSAGLAAAPTLTTAFNSANPLATQLQMVARTIAARNALGTKRQVFFVSLGGFDLHDNLLTQHPGLLTNVSEAISSFYAATVELGVASQVTTFTASDFGRTLTSNGDGSDHGWGSHHFVLGGAVAGQQFYGKLPSMAVNGPDDVGQGRLLPTTSVDQLGAALATWFGVPVSDLPTVFPNVGNFDLGTLPLFQ
ncbi:MAG TPA: DUF1501 domain-containing protein [Burkholderiaceae bacterium]|mgnify:CR=1 FL=1|nr:DUF1501 domain-containing protein [Burkholderiaceae bacterium]